jgi:Ca-activated chloride channel family protein
MRTLLFSIVLMSFGTLFAQKTISGTVSDENGPLPGVSIIIKGTRTGTETDFDGKYTIQAQVGNVLVYSYVGKMTIEKTVGTSNTMDVYMADNNNVLEEVVVVSYKADKKTTPKSVQELGTQTQNLLSGEVSGVKIRGYNSVGSSSKILLRGYSSMPQNNESYSNISENIFKTPLKDPLSTFSIDVDKASYANVRRMINNGEKVPNDAVKIEEMINYFNYNYAQPLDEHPFAIHTETAVCPWNEEHVLVKIGLQGKTIESENLPASNLVFLIDVSGSMQDVNKLPLLKSAFKLLVNQLREKDKVAIVVYAGAAGVVLEPTSGDQKEKIISALDQLQAGGSTAGAAGIQLAYQLAEKHFKEKGNNRVILATDGDFNVGTSSDSDLEKLIEEKRKSGVFLTVLGFGMGNYKDSKLETLADKGNGNHAYIDNMQEAQKVLGTEFGGTLYTIAKDVKIQVEFNPNKVQAYRLIGYENRLLNDEDFVDDTIDAGEIGSGHTVTALYEIIPQGVKSKFTKDLPQLKYSDIKANTNYESELLTVKFRYKKPDQDESIELVKIVPDDVKSVSETPDDFRFAASVAMFGMQLRSSEFKGKTDYDEIIALASNAKGNDQDGYKSEFVRLVKTVK